MSEETKKNELSADDMLRLATAYCDNLQFGQALPLLLELAELAVPEAMAHLGYLYKYGGDGVAANDALSAEWYLKYFARLEQRCNHGDLDAGYLLASSYQYGDGMPANESAAYSLYLRCAESGHPASQFRLAMLWRYGWCGLDENIAESERWLQRAVASSYPEALYQRGFDLMSLSDGNDAMAFEMIKKAADAGFWPAAEYLRKRG